MKNIWRLRTNVFILLILIFFCVCAFGVEKNRKLNVLLNDSDDRGGWFSVF